MKRGFTLIELMVALACLAILGGIALPALFTNHFLPSYRLRWAARDLATELLHARMKAASSNREYRVVIDARKEEYRVEKGNRSTGSDAWTMESDIRSFSDPDNPHYQHAIEIVSASRANIIFKPTGTATLTTITIRNRKGDVLAITTSIAGRIKVTGSK